MSYEIIAFSDEWFGLPCSCKHLLNELLPEHRVVWVESIGLRAPGLNKHDLRRSINKIKGWVSHKNHVPKALPANLSLVNPFQIPYNSYQWIHNINKTLILRSLKQHLKKSNSARILFTTCPFLGNIIGSLSEDLAVYYRVDEFAELPGVNREVIRQLELDLISKCDLMLASAERLMEVGETGRDVCYLPHGVDFKHFSSCSPARLPIMKTRHPVIGFFGILSSWIDFHLISSLADLEPEWSFVLIGPSIGPSLAMPLKPNIYYLGQVPYEELPRFAQNFDVGIIPFKINRLTLPVNPLKLLEYFAMGIPVVSTPLPEVMKFNEHVSIASCSSDFRDAIAKCLNENKESDKRERQIIARANSWGSRAKQLEDILDSRLEKKIASRSHTALNQNV
jgi:glycosyltransferase involved in cell wall biosynthesis